MGGVTPMVQDPNLSRSVRHVRRGRSVAYWILNFLMCWLALVGLWNVVVGIASFAFDTYLHLFGKEVVTTAQRLQWIALYSTFSAIGFTYMIWRNKWQFRINTLLILAVLWCIFFATAALTKSESIVSFFLTGVMALVLFYYCVCWANQQQSKISTPEAIVSSNE